MPIHGYPGGVISSTAPTIAPTGASGVWTTETQLQNSANWPSADYITRSLRFNSADTAYLSRTPASASNRKTWTWSGWVKRSKLSGSFYFFCGNSALSDAGFFGINFEGNDRIEVTGWTTVWRSTSAQYRDPSAWYHIVVALDTTQATADNRVRVYVNGSEVTAFATKNNPSQNADLGVNTAAVHYLSSYNASASLFDGYLADVTFVDGLALTPSSFGAADPNTGEWQPQVYHGAYGTNGFFLRFANNTNTTSTTLGLDSSGNGNNWTPNNFSVTAGAGNDSLVDVPSSYGTDTGVGGEVRGNYATLNSAIPPLTSQATTVLSNGNLDFSVTQTNSTYGAGLSTIGVSSGKWYFEYLITAVRDLTGVGFINAANLAGFQGGNYGIATPSDGWARNSTGSLSSNATTLISGLPTFTNNDIVICAIDFDAGKMWFGKNGTWDSSGNPAAGTNALTTFTPGGKTFLLGVQAYTSSGSVTGSINFGQRPFSYTAPAGFNCLVDTNLPTPTIGATSTTRAGNYFNTVLWTGTGASLNVTGVGFQPDFVWNKSRSNAQDHRVFDVLRGTSNALFTNSTLGDYTESGITSFNSDGFTIGSAGNTNGYTYVSWNWKANGAGSSNTSGTITSTVSVNSTSGFSIVTYTGNATAGATVGHGLNVAPSFVILKSRSVATSWYVWSTGLTSAEYEIYLNLTDAEFNGAFSFLYDAAPTATTFSLPTAGYGSNNSGATYVAYCFAPVAGYSAFGKYSGNSSSDGPFIYTGFRPAWVMWKNSSAASQWILFDVKRWAYNIMNGYLEPNTTDAENTSSAASGVFDILSNGFKLRVTGTDYNQSGNTYIYAAFAEFPFKFARAR